MTAPSRSLRYDADNARRRAMRHAAIAARDAERARENAAIVRHAASALQQREIRVVSVGHRRIALGALAGTDTGHPFMADGHTATSCLLCFGWSNDYRHWAGDGRG